MGANKKETSNSVASQAAQVLRNPNASAVQRTLAGSALSQSGTGRQTGAAVEAKAGRALQNQNSAAVTRRLAGSVVSQSNKGR